MKYFFALLLLFASPVLPQELSPDALVRNITQEVISAVKQDKEVQPGNSRKIVELVDSKVLPHFNFMRMTQLAVAVNWRKATPEQQKLLTQEFRTLLVRTYSSALSMYRGQLIEIKPLRARADDTEVTVRSEVKQWSAQPVTIDYDMEKTTSGWKVFDVKVGGVSLITTYKEEFANQIRESGLDGLIKTLTGKNRQAEGRVGT